MVLGRPKAVRGEGTHTHSRRHINQKCTAILQQMQHSQLYQPAHSGQEQAAQPSAHAHTHTRTHTCTHTHTCAHTHMRARTHMRTYTHTHTYTCVRTHTPACPNTHQTCTSQAGPAWWRHRSGSAGAAPPCAGSPPGPSGGCSRSSSCSPVAEGRKKVGAHVCPAVQVLNMCRAGSKPSTAGAPPAFPVQRPTHTYTHRSTQIHARMCTHIQRSTQIHACARTHACTGVRKGSKRSLVQVRA